MNPPAGSRCCIIPQIRFDQSDFTMHMNLCPDVGNQIHPFVKSDQTRPLSLIVNFLDNGINPFHCICPNLIRLIIPPPSPFLGKIALKKGEGELSPIGSHKLKFIKVRAEGAGPIKSTRGRINFE